MVRTQIQLTEEQYHRLKLAANRQDVAMAEIIRGLVERWMEESAKETKFSAAMSIVGKYHDSANDVSSLHDDYLAEVWGS